MAYVPDPLDPAFPTGANFVGSLTAELRAIKTQLVSNLAGIDQNVLDIAQNASDISALAAVVGGGRYELLTGTGNFNVPLGVTQVLVIAVGGGEGGQGGHARIKASIEGNLTSGWSTPEYCGKGGNSGNVQIGVFAVTPEEVIGYTCGAGGSGGSANNADITTTIDIDLGKPNGWVSYQSNRPVFSYLNDTPADFATKRAPSGVLVQVVAQIQLGDTAGNPRISCLFGKEQTGCLGSLGGDGGNTTFGVLLTATGGSDKHYSHGGLRNIFTGLGNYGRGGNGGNSRHGEVSAVAATAGEAGQPGAILVIW